MDQAGTVRRADFYLRSKYVEIDSTIYQITDDKYLIYCPESGNDFETLKQDFNYSIKPLTVPVDLTNSIPAQFIKMIPSINDKEISKNFEGVGMTKIDLLNILIGKFPNVYFYKIDESPDRIILVRTYRFKEKIGDTTYSRFLNTSDRDKIMRFLTGTKTPIAFEIIEDEVETPPDLELSIQNPVQYIYSNGFKRKNTLEFSQRDEAIYYDNIDKVFEGEFKKKDLFFYTPDEYSCYVDYSSFENIDLRNHLFLFQTVYLTLPYEKDIKTWLDSKKITEDEFLELVKRGRIKVILTQPEFRYQIDFFNEIYKANPNAIITRRAVTTLQQIDLVELSDNYILNDIKILKELKPFCEIMAKGLNTEPGFLYDMMVWPIKARRNSFESIQRNGLIGLPQYGVNTAIDKSISKAAGKDFSFEFHTSAASIHLANSLNATYFPFTAHGGYSDYYFANVMGDLLNFYKNATVANIKDFANSKEQTNSGILPISPIDVIEINDYISITELETVLSKSNVYPNSKRLIEHLASLSPQERKIKINEYNTEVQNNINKKGKHSGVIDLGVNIALDGVGMATGFGPIGTVLSALKLGGKVINKSVPELKNLNSKIEEAFYTDIDKANIHYLTKINRVAKVKRF